MKPKITRGEPELREADGKSVGGLRPLSSNYPRDAVIVSPFAGPLRKCTVLCVVWSNA